ncbi:MAG: DUF4118 domain-containing protein [Armatimonadetes bacterium]|nr:DUF4118 domain-containing protein [Armatimonadota bacterium]
MRRMETSPRTTTSTWEHTLAGYAAAVASVAGMTGAIHFIPGAIRIANVSMLYLLVVIGAALLFGSGPAILASILSFLAFDWFFVQPHRTLTVGDPAEWLALIMFLITATVTGHLTALLRARADEARRRERETAALAQASWAVASQVDRDRALAEVLRRIGEVVPLEAGAIITPDAGGSPCVVVSCERGGTLPEVAGGPVLTAFQFVLDQGQPVAWDGDRLPGAKALPRDGRSEEAYLPLTAEHRVLGVLYLVFAKGSGVSYQEKRVVESLANHAAVVLERDRLARAETAAKALAEADRLKTALLSMVSHDFRSPLAGVKASVSSLLQDGQPLDAATQRELLEGIDQEADRLNRIVGNILALSRLEADAWRPQREPTPLEELVGTALGSFSRDENRRIQVCLRPAIPEVWLDPTQIVQVLRNLLENALKYSPSGSPVELRVHQEGGEVVLEVLDRGAGLPRGEEHRIFEPFYRAPALRESALPGVGIGLAVCRGLVEAHHGALTARNREGGGAAFEIRLPIQPPCFPHTGEAGE